MSVSGISQRQLAWPAHQSFQALSQTAAPFQLPSDQFQSRKSNESSKSPHLMASPRFKGNIFSGESITHGAAPENCDADPDFKSIEKTNPEKLQTAQELGDWLQDTLRRKDAQVAIVSRNGSAQVQQHDPTGMAHSGIAVRCEQDQTWHVYNLINHAQGELPQAGIYKSTLTDFFYEQHGLKKDGLVMIPPKDIQQKMAEGIQNGQYKKLFFTRDYNFISVPHTTRSLNCNKWVLMNIMAAQKQNYNPMEILKHIQENFQPGIINVNPILRPFAKRQPIIIGSEVPAWAPIQTVTVESLYHSGLFEEKEFFSKRELVKKPPETSSALTTYAPIAGGIALIPLLYFTLRIAGRKNCAAAIQRAVIKYLFSPNSLSRY